MSAQVIRLESIAIQDFRNPSASISISLPKVSRLIGDNGHGKTNLLEAIYYLQILRSIRDARDQDLTRFDATGFHIAAKAHPRRTRDRRRVRARVKEEKGHSSMASSLAD